MASRVSPIHRWFVHIRLLDDTKPPHRQKVVSYRMGPFPSWSRAREVATKWEDIHGVGTTDVSMREQTDLRTDPAGALAERMKWFIHILLRDVSLPKRRQCVRAFAIGPIQGWTRAKEIAENWERANGPNTTDISAAHQPVEL